MTEVAIEDALELGYLFGELFGEERAEFGAHGRALLFGAVEPLDEAEEAGALFQSERALDTGDGFLRIAIDRYAGHDLPHYAGYPERPGWPDRERLVADLLAAPERLGRAEEAGRAADAAGDRVPVSAAGWSPSGHLAHLLQFEIEAVTPRVEGASSSATPVWEDWLASDPPPDSESPFEELTRRFAEARARTVAALREAGADALDRTARLGRERLTLYQFLRGIRQHDEAHARRIEQRVHPDLLRPRATGRAG